MLSWKYFLDELPKEKADKCVFILHTELVSDHGTDLSAIANLIFGENSPHIRFSTNKLSAQHLNYLYNLADAQILLTSNEGWGLSLTEALLTGTPIIANVTGGMQDQMRFEDKNGNWIDFDSNFPSNHRGTYKKHGKWAYPVYPSSRSLKGSPKTPYIWDDTCDPEDASKQIMKLYKMSPEQRKKSGMKGYKWAIGDEAGFTAKHQAQRVIKSIDKTFEDFQPREKFEFINTNEYKIETVPHKLLY
jgi:glycosyltransferase involved in cell wall biosynthesis